MKHAIGWDLDTVSHSESEPPRPSHILEVCKQKSIEEELLVF